MAVRTIWPSTSEASALRTKVLVWPVFQWIVLVPENSEAGALHACGAVKPGVVDRCRVDARMGQRHARGEGA